MSSILDKDYEAFAAEWISVLADDEKDTHEALSTAYRRYFGNKNKKQSDMFADSIIDETVNITALYETAMTAPDTFADNMYGISDGDNAQMQEIINAVLDAVRIPKCGTMSDRIYSFAETMSKQYEDMTEETAEYQMTLEESVGRMNRFAWSSAVLYACSKTDMEYADVTMGQAAAAGGAALFGDIARDHKLGAIDDDEYHKRGFAAALAMLTSIAQNTAGAVTVPLLTGIAAACGIMLIAAPITAAVLTVAAGIVCKNKLELRSLEEDNTEKFLDKQEHYSQYTEDKGQGDAAPAHRYESSELVDQLPQGD